MQQVWVSARQRTCTLQYRTRETVQFLQQETSEFMSPDVCGRLTVIDTKPVDCKIWVGLYWCKGVCTRHPSETPAMQLKQHLIDTWSIISQGIIDYDFDQWWTPLRSCMKAKGRHFEHVLYTKATLFITATHYATGSLEIYQKYT